jgi:hypothetical protein
LIKNRLDTLGQARKREETVPLFGIGYSLPRERKGTKIQRDHGEGKKTEGLG